MLSHPIPPDVVAFVAEHVGSLQELELLRTLIETPERWWDDTMLARELRVPETTARNVLHRLAGRNLLDISVTDNVRYRFQPGTSHLTHTVDAFTQAYRRDPIGIALIVTRGERRALADFSDAFRLRHDDR